MAPPRVGLYLADQSWRRTLSKGIYSYSRLLAAQLLEKMPDCRWVLLVNGENRTDMLGRAAPDVEVHVLPAACASGLPRVVADQMVAPYLARRLRLDLLHFPKGFLPLVPCGSTRASLTIHDLIPLFYEQRYPGYFRPAKISYLRASYLHGLRRGHAIVTSSRGSESALRDLAVASGIEAPPIARCHDAPHPEVTEGPPEGGLSRPEPRLLHVGSLLPHKRTRRTLELFRAFNRAEAGRWRLGVVGLRAAPSEWALPNNGDVEFLGPLSADELRAAIVRSRALLFLSEIEGFGLPALEAWFLGTPVCYSAEAVAEVLDGLPGHCAALEEAPFGQALHSVLALGEEERAAHRRALREKYGPAAFGERMSALVRGWLEDPPRR